MENVNDQPNENPELRLHAVSGSGVVWNAPGNSNATGRLKQHAFVRKQCGKWWEQKHEGNSSLCGQVGIADENERFIPVYKIEAEKLEVAKACIKCRRLFIKRHCR